MSNFNVLNSGSLCAKYYKCSPLFLAGNYYSKLLIVTLLLLAGDVEVNPGPGGSFFPCVLCEMYDNWSNGGIACKHCDVIIIIIIV